MNKKLIKQAEQINTWIWPGKYYGYNIKDIPLGYLRKAAKNYGVGDTRNIPRQVARNEITRRSKG